MTATISPRSVVVDGLHIIEYRVSEYQGLEYQGLEYQGGGRCEVPAVVLLHGIGGSAQSCAPLARELAHRGISAWCFDAAGYGESEDPVSVHHDFVADALRVAATVSPERPLVLVGTSWGGVVAASAALRRPDRVAGLVLVDSTRGSGTSTSKAEAMRARASDMGHRGADVLAAERAARLTAPGADPAVVESVRRSIASLRRSGFSAAAEFMASTDLGPFLGDITCPTAVVVGEADVITGVEESRLLAERIPGARFHEIADAGHVAVQEQPAAVAALVCEFIERAS